MEVTEGTDKEDRGVAGPVDVCRYGISTPWCDAPCQPPPYSAMSCEGPKNYGRRPRSVEMSRAKQNKEKAWFSRMDEDNEYNHAPSSSAAIASMFDAQGLGPVTTTLYMWLFCKQLLAG